MIVLGQNQTLAILTMAVAAGAAAVIHTQVWNFSLNSRAAQRILTDSIMLCCIAVIIFAFAVFVTAFFYYFSTLLFPKKNSHNYMHACPVIFVLSDPGPTPGPSPPAPGLPSYCPKKEDLTVAYGTPTIMDGGWQIKKGSTLTFPVNVVVRVQPCGNYITYDS